jgi:hypothetical protein
MKITLKVADGVLGTADWDQLPKVGQDVLLFSQTTQANEVRSVVKIEDEPSGGKIVHFGAARPRFVYR